MNRLSRYLPYQTKGISKSCRYTNVQTSNQYFGIRESDPIASGALVLATDPPCVPSDAIKDIIVSQVQTYEIEPS